MRISSPFSWWCLSCAVILAALVGVLPAQTEIEDQSPVPKVDAFDDTETPPESETPEDGMPSTELPGEDTNWLEAVGSEQLGAQVRSSAILLGPDGMLHCSLFRLDPDTRQEIAVRHMEIKLILDGKEIETTEPDPDDGKFQFGPVKPGIYAIVGYGEDGFAAFSFAVDQLPLEAEDMMDGEAPADGETPVDDESPAGDAPPAGEAKPEPVLPMESLTLIHSSAIDPKDVPMAMQLIRAFVDGGAGGGASMQAEAEAAMEDTPVEEPATTSTSPFRNLTRDSHVALSTSLHWHTVRLQPDGTLIGRILTLVEMNQAGEVKAVPPEDMQVFVLKDGRVVSRGPCGEKGSFVIPDLQPDIYSFIGAGKDGFVALTVDVLPGEEKPEGEEPTVKSASLRRTAFLQNENENTLNIFTTIVPPEGANYLPPPPQTNNQFTQNDDFPLSMTAGDTPGGGPSSSGNSGNPTGIGGGGIGGNTGGFGGGAGAGGGGGTNGVPEIDPASSGVGLSVLIGLLFLLIDLYRPR